MAYDVVVLGAGPAAMAAAAACVSVGLDVARVDPAPGRAWPNTYGVWVDELAGLGLDATLAVQWAEVTVVGRERHVLGRPYGVFDNQRLASELDERAAGAPVVHGRVVGANHDRRRSTAVLHDGRFLDATVLIDATGAQPALVHGPERPHRAEQVAYGVVAQCVGLPYEPGSCVLMDWSFGEGGDRRPTFLYALDLGDDWWLLEETSLAAHPPMALTELEGRLHTRLAALGVVVRRVRAIEEVGIPLGGPLPDLHQRAVGLGAAAAQIHPATGYSVGAALRAAPVVAATIVQALERRATPEAISAACWAALWPASRLRARGLEAYGLDALLRFDLGDTRRFFDAFFALPPDQWHGYLSGTLAPGDVVEVMRAVFAAVPATVRLRLAAGSPLPVLRGLRPA